jgi:hypothetical protein
VYAQGKCSLLLMRGSSFYSRFPMICVLPQIFRKSRKHPLGRRYRYFIPFLIDCSQTTVTSAKDQCTLTWAMTTRLPSHKRVYKTVGDQEIDVDVYAPSNANRCPVSKYNQSGPLRNGTAQS